MIRRRARITTGSLRNEASQRLAIPVEFYRLGHQPEHSGIVESRFRISPASLAYLRTTMVGKTAETDFMRTAGQIMNGSKDERQFQKRRTPAVWNHSWHGWTLT